MRSIYRCLLIVICCCCLVSLDCWNTTRGQADKSARPAPEDAVLARLAEIQAAAQALDADKVFSFVVDNDRGALIQNGQFYLTRKEALESTRRGFQVLQKIEYKFNQQHVTFPSPSVALATGEGVSSATTVDGRTFTTAFTQSVLLTLTNNEWKVFHAHRSFPPAR